uniref:Glucosidase II beta subunit N-terminal domain-containing protein n=1 Tax=Anopheles atroparvus TaxID=41427 RepID=A0A182J9G6_ANOAO
MRKTWVKRDNIYYKPFYKQKLKLTLIGVIGMGILFFVYQLVYISQLLPLETAPAGPNSRPLKANSNDNPIASPELVGQEDTARSDVQHERAHQKAGAELAHANGTAVNRASPWGDTKFAYVEKIGSYERKILRGIRLSDLDRYSERPQAVSFRCLASGREIPWHWVNDDYCDCPDDGSDEPSTNACQQGRYFCRFQKRHNTGRGMDLFVPSAWVNDGVCDCCDGSDEWLTSVAAGSPGACRNICKTKYFL